MKVYKNLWLQVHSKIPRCELISKEEKSFGFFVFVYILCVFVYVFLGSQSQGSYISRDFVVDL